VSVKESNKRILYVEDQLDEYSLVAEILSDYEVIAACNKADALARARAETFDLYLLDYHLPDGTWYELCLLIRAFDPDTPIFFCTGTSSITEETMKTAGAQKLIKKGDDFVDNLSKAVSEVFMP